MLSSVAIFSFGKLSFLSTSSKVAVSDSSHFISVSLFSDVRQTMLGCSELGICFRNEAMLEFGRCDDENEVLLESAGVVCMLILMCFGVNNIFEDFMDVCVLLFVWPKLREK